MATNRLQRIGVSERVGQTLCCMVCCLLVDSGHTPKMWGELILTVTYLCNRMPHSGLDMETTLKHLYGKEANLSHLKIIGGGAFVHIKDAEKLEPKSWEAMLCGFGEKETISYRIWNPKIYKAVESRNITFIETPPHLAPQSTWLSPLRELPSGELDSDYALRGNLLRDARDYPAVLDINVSVTAEHTCKLAAYL